MTKIIYPDEDEFVEISLPHRTLMDFEAIEFLHSRGVISDKVAIEEYTNVVGITKERVQKKMKMKLNT